MTKTALKEMLFNNIKKNTMWKGCIKDGNNIVYWSEHATNTIVYDDNDNKVMSITRRHSDGVETIIKYR